MSTPDFSDLQPWIDAWGREDAHDRLRVRSARTLAEQRAFHAALVPRLEAIIEFLNRFDLEAIPEAHRPLAWTALAVCEVDDAVNVWKAPVLEHASDPCAWRVKTSPYDYR